MYNNFRTPDARDGQRRRHPLPFFFPLPFRKLGARGHKLRLTAIALFLMHITYV